MRKKILIVDACQFTPNYNNCLLDALVQKGIDIVYATTEFFYAESPIPDGVNTKYCFFYLARLAHKLTSSDRIRRFLRALEYPFNLCCLFFYILISKIKVVHLMWLVIPTVDMLMIKALQKMGCKVVLTTHNAFPHDSEDRFVHKYSRIYNQVDHLIVLTDFTRCEIIKKSKVSSRKISIAPHGDFDYVLSKCPENKSLVDEVIAKASGRKVVTFLGLIRPYKGLEYLIKAYGIIKQLDPNVFFLIAGNTRFANKEHIEKLLDENSESSERHVDFRYISMSDMRAYLSVTDVLVLPYINASQSGNTVMAYSAGIPVICTDVGGLSEMVDDGKSGYVISSKNPRAIAEAVVKCLGEENYARMSEYAVSLSKGEFGWEAIADKTIEVYDLLA